MEHVNNAHGNTVLHVVENIHAIQVEQPDNIQIPIEGIELKFLDRVPGTWYIVRKIGVLLNLVKF